MAAVSGEDVPKEVWHKILGHLSSDPESLFRAGQVGRTLKAEASDQRFWSNLRKSWSPEFFGSLRTGVNGKDLRRLYRQWHRGKPSREDLIDEYAHDPAPVLAHLTLNNDCRGFTGVYAIKLSQAGALVAWSVGTDKALLQTDMTTCQTCRWFTAEDDDGLSCLDVLNADGVALSSADVYMAVFTGGKNSRGWDPRQGPNRPTFELCYGGQSVGSGSVTAIVSDESSGQPMVLTGGSGGGVCLWDLRTNQILTSYETHLIYPYDSIECLALEPRRGTLIGGGPSGLYFWNFTTVGTERMIVSGRHGVFEWALPDPLTGVARQLQGVLAVQRYPAAFPTRPELWDRRVAVLPAMQGMGEGPAGILAGTADGSIGMWMCQNNPEQAQRQCDNLDFWSSPHPLPQPPPVVVPEHLQAPVMWSDLEPHDLNWAVTCLAATDEVVVNGFSNGKIRIVRMKEQY